MLVSVDRQENYMSIFIYTKKKHAAKNLSHRLFGNEKKTKQNKKKRKKYCNTDNITNGNEKTPVDCTWTVDGGRLTG